MTRTLLKVSSIVCFIVLINQVVLSRSNSDEYRKDFLKLLKNYDLVRDKKENSGACGEKPVHLETRIVGGRTATPGAWPWQVSIQFLKEGTTTYNHVCGGVLVDPYWILTVAHCVDKASTGDARREDKSNYHVVLGLDKLSNIGANQQVVGVAEIVKHEDFVADKTSYPNDIALLKLVTSADTTKSNIGLGCLPTADMPDFAGNPNCWITGWGKTDAKNKDFSDTLQEANVQVIANDLCSELVMGTVLDTHICAGYGLPNTCNGDSGGGLSCKVSDSWYIAGLGSWTFLTCSNTPAVFTRVTKYLDWINSRINS